MRRNKPKPLENLGNEIESPPPNDDIEQFFQNTQFRSQPINPDDTEHLADLGCGSSGRVTKVRHIPTNQILARKIINIDLRLADRNRIMSELGLLSRFQSPYIVGYLSEWYRPGEINLFMEYMDGNSLDEMLKKLSKIDEPILGKIAVSVIKGLDYLRSKDCMHRDIKPSNILVNSRGEIKICDFGVSKQLSDSIANSFVGTRYYMAPERLTGVPYNVQSDIWSLGLTLAELALGQYPIPQDDPKKMYEGECPRNNQMSVFDQINLMQTAKSPTVPIEYFSQEFKDFIDGCLQKDRNQRLDLRGAQLHPFFIKSEASEVDIAGWVCSAHVGLARTPQ